MQTSGRLTLVYQWPILMPVFREQATQWLINNADITAVVCLGVAFDEIQQSNNKTMINLLGFISNVTFLKNKRRHRHIFENQNVPPSVSCVE